MPTFLFNHIALAVKDVDQSLEFYQKVFKLTEIKNTASDSKTRWLLIDQARQLHLIPRPNSEIKSNKAVHFAMSTPDFNCFVLFLKEVNIPFSDWLDAPNKVYIRKDGIKQVYFQDPDGYWIEVNNDCL